MTRVELALVFSIFFQAVKRVQSKKQSNVQTGLLYSTVAGNGVGLADFSASGARFICKVAMEDDEAQRLGTAIVGMAGRRRDMVVRQNNTFI